MNKYICFRVVIAACVLLLSGCRPKNMLPPDNQEACYDLTLEDDTNMEAGWTWLEVTVGKSTFADLIAIHGEPVSRQGFTMDSMSGCTYQYEFDDAGNISFIGNNGQIREIWFHSPAYPLGSSNTIAFLEDVVYLYGTPELVGFDKTFGSHTRIVVWASAGVQSTVGIDNESLNEDGHSMDIKKAMLYSISYFIPVSPEEYINSFYSHSFSDTRPESDVLDTYSRDPFKWGD